MGRSTVSLGSPAGARYDDASSDPNLSSGSATESARMPVPSASTMTWNATISFRAANSRTPAPSHTALPRRPGCVRSSRSTLSPSPMAQTALTSAAAVPNPIAQSTTARTIRLTAPPPTDLSAPGSGFRSAPSWGRAAALQDVLRCARAPRHLRASRARWCDRPRSGSRNTARNCSMASRSRPSARSTRPLASGDEAGGAGTALNQRRRAPVGRFGAPARQAAGSTGPMSVAASYASATSTGVPPRARRCTRRQSGPGGSARAAALFDACCRDLEPGRCEQRADAFGREPRQRWRVAHLPQCFHRGPAVVALGQRSCALQLHLERGPLQVGRTLPREGRTGSRTGASASEKRPASANASASVCTIAGGAPARSG